MQGFQVVGRRGNLGLGSFQKLLVALVNQLGNFGADQVAGISEDLDATIFRLLDRSRNVVFLYKDAAAGSGCLEHVKGVLAQVVYGVFKCFQFELARHLCCSIPSMSARLDAAPMQREYAAKLFMIRGSFSIIECSC